jgi:hypothetical protein
MPFFVCTIESSLPEMWKRGILPVKLKAIQGCVERAAPRNQRTVRSKKFGSTSPLRLKASGQR